MVKCSSDRLSQPSVTALKYAHSGATRRAGRCRVPACLQLCSPGPLSHSFESVCIAFGTAKQSLQASRGSIFRLSFQAATQASMPTYEYRCPEGHDFEKFFSRISESVSELPCPECGEIAERRISGGAGLLFKGSGFYLTDYGKNAHRKPGPDVKESKGSSGEGKSAAESGSGSGSGSKAGESGGGSGGGGGGSDSGGGSSSSSKGDSGGSGGGKSGSGGSGGGGSSGSGSGKGGSSGGNRE
jgi:putative FmdB family regulatory protein